MAYLGLNTNKLCTADCVITVIVEHTRCPIFIWKDSTKVKLDKIIISNVEASPIFYIAVKFYITTNFDFIIFTLKHLCVIFKSLCFIHFILQICFSNFFCFKRCRVIVIYLCSLYVSIFSTVYKQSSKLFKIIALACNNYVMYCRFREKRSHRSFSR